jgi:hypothetical protein
MLPSSILPASPVAVDAAFDEGGGAVVQGDLGHLPSVSHAATILPLTAKAFPVDAAIL